jgi:hypothetical protein
MGNVYAADVGAHEVSKYLRLRRAKKREEVGRRESGYWSAPPWNHDRKWPDSARWATATQPAVA